MNSENRKAIKKRKTYTEFPDMATQNQTHANYSVTDKQT